MKKTIFALCLLGVATITGCGMSSASATKKTSVTVNTESNVLDSDVSLQEYLSDMDSITLNIHEGTILIPNEATISVAYTKQEIAGESEKVTEENITVAEAIEKGIIDNNFNLVSAANIDNISYHYVDDFSNFSIAFDISLPELDEDYVVYDIKEKEILENSGYYNILEKNSDTIRYKADDGTDSCHILFRKGVGDSFMMDITYNGSPLINMDTEQILSAINLK